MNATTAAPWILSSWARFVIEAKAESATSSKILVGFMSIETGVDCPKVDKAIRRKSDKCFMQQEYGLA
jgi:hypothetical protein